MASLTQWTWVWVDSRSWWWTGRPGMLRFMGSQRVRHDWATKLTDWAILFYFLYYFSVLNFIDLCSSLYLFFCLIYVFFSLFSPFFLIFCSGILDYLRLFFSFLVQAFNSIKFPLSIALTISYKFWYIAFSFSFSSFTFFNFLWDFLFDPWII